MKSELLNAAMKGNVSETHKLNGPYKFYAEINGETCFSVSKQLGTYENPEVEVYMESPVENGFATLRVIVPTMSVIQRSRVSDELFRTSMQFIQSNALDIIEVAEGKTKI